MQAHPVLTESICQQDQVAQIPGEPIQAPHEHIGHVPLFHHGQQPLEAGPLEVLARPSGVLDDGNGSEVVELGIGPELLGLPVDRETLGRLLLGRDPAVRDVQHLVGHLRSARWTIRSAIVTRTDATRSRSQSWARFESVAADVPSSGRSRDSSGALLRFACDPESLLPVPDSPGRRGLKGHVGAAAPGIGAWSRRGRCDGGGQHRHQ